MSATSESCPAQEDAEQAIYVESVHVERLLSSYNRQVRAWAAEGKLRRIISPGGRAKYCLADALRLRGQLQM